MMQAGGKQQFHQSLFNKRSLKFNPNKSKLTSRTNSLNPLGLKPSCLVLLRYYSIAIFSHANLKRSNLKHANLNGIKLDGTDLQDANTDGVNKPTGAN